jgi:hypothetical protein
VSNRSCLLLCFKADIYGLWIASESSNGDEPAEMQAEVPKAQVKAKAASSHRGVKRPGPELTQPAKRVAAARNNEKPDAIEVMVQHYRTMFQRPGLPAGSNAVNADDVAETFLPLMNAIDEARRDNKPISMVAEMLEEALYRAVAECSADSAAFDLSEEE